jgi:hypothetical protein
MKIIGTIIPFIGFRTHQIDNDGFPTEIYTGYESDCFEVEWFGQGFIIFSTNVRKSK